MARKRAAKSASQVAAKNSDADRTKEDILSVATEEFAIHGLSGARVDAIAERTRTSKRMIYYYFGGKEGLYKAVLEKAYSDIRTLEAQSNLAKLSPLEAIRKLVELTFDYDETHPQFIRLVSVENIHQGKHLSKLKTIREMNASVIRTLEDILERGRAEGVFRQDLDPVDIHLLVSAFCFFRVSNRYTFGAIFERDLSDPKLRKKHKKIIVEAVERLLEVRGDKPAA
jgi:AcrR family transcriptional regulator